MCKTKNDELLLRISELGGQLKDAHIASEYATLQAETVANIAKKKEQELEAQIIVLETKLDRTRGINRDQLKNVESNYAELRATAEELETANQEYMATAEELDVANIDKGARAAELVIANKEKGARAAELAIANKKLIFDNDEKDARVAELVIANKEKDARAAELVIANKEKDARAAELVIAKEKLVSENEEKDARLAALDIANKEKDARAAELVIANKEKDARAAELVIAKEKLVSENEEKDARLAALDIANKEKDARAAELVIANKEKDARAAELVIAKEKLVFENEEKDARLAALDIANKEKDARAAELVIANKEKDAREAELVIANKELAYQNDEKEAFAVELESAGEKAKASLQEKEVLLKEIHHRVKNNLQIISSMLSLQARAEPDAASRKALEECQRRVKVMARIHESLHQSNNVTAVDARDYINAIAADTVDSSRINSQKVETLVEVDKINIDIDTAIVCGQIFSELYSNCIKHAFPDERSGNIKVTMRRADKGRMELRVVDDGIGLPEDFNLHKSATLGMKLIGALTTQLNGEISIDGSCGTSVWITFEGKQ
jgi:two-component sensor histidine kinase